MRSGPTLTGTPAARLFARQFFLSLASTRTDCFREQASTRRSTNGLSNLGEGRSAWISMETGICSLISWTASQMAERPRSFGIKQTRYAWSHTSSNLEADTTHCMMLVHGVTRCTVIFRPMLVANGPICHAAISRY